MKIVINEINDTLEKEEIECTIDLKTNTFQCANENSENIEV